ncbi:hypothetical protein BN59_02090 [Legionella massiliensis]|uniref:Dot/Icm secretion system substrate n=2 Tax=Legionella massiliensis TaxID=1034943 RepID=A0A078KTJ5_9GAMM|nr:hypothetical protein BN59_02090 [Legionella massiliensis]CEE13538.1 hypothetical protein BN1094_02090 [Legionella massiliensis]
METLEHKQAGDQIRIETFTNPYLEGSKNLNTADTNKLKVTMMQTIDGIPVPLDLKLSAGDIVAMAGDYYTSAGWGYSLELPKPSGDVVSDNKKLFNNPVQAKEKQAFHDAFADLASTEVSQKDIERIYQIEKTTYVPFIESLNQIIQQIAYIFAVKDYSEKLSKNAAHFAPWSTRAYVVGHESALDNANLAYHFKQIAAGNVIDDETVSDELSAIVERIEKNPAQYGFTAEQIDNKQDFYTELSNRYHALAVSQDLFAMHFYSDHFAGGHMSRIGLLRTVMPEQFGVWGNILINNMHNEDNHTGVKTTNPFQPNPNWQVGDVFAIDPEKTQSYGDGTYFQRSNDENANLLVNGMDNSLGDIARLMQSGEKRSAENYGGLAFLPEIDYSQPQPQPLLLQAADGKVYFRADVSHIKMLSPEAYAAAQQRPAENGYEELTPFKAFILVIKLRVFGFIFAPKLEVPSTELVSEPPRLVAVETEDSLGYENTVEAEQEPLFELATEHEAEKTTKVASMSYVQGQTLFGSLANQARKQAFREPTIAAHQGMIPA